MIDNAPDVIPEGLSTDGPVTSPVDDAAAKLVIKKRNKDFQQQISTCKQYRRKLVQNWSLNIDYRRGKPFSSQTDEDRIAVNLDWSHTKQKQALLFSQVPAARVNHPPNTTSKEVTPWLHAFEQKINDTLVTAGIETSMDEVLPDCINAAGIGVIMVAREAITTDIEVPAIDMSMMPPEMMAMVMQSGTMPDGTPIPMETVPKVIDSRYLVSRLSPGDFLWPLNFVGSDFDNSPWLGRSGRVTWPEAVKRFNLKESEKSKYLGEDRTPMDRLSDDLEKEKTDADDMVSFDEIFYKEFQYDVEAKSFTAIHHLVFVGDKKEPVIDEPWKGQQIDEESQQLIGALRYPIRVLSLAYVTDEAIPPSDTAIGRPQVNELNKSRTQMILQREHSLPVRWFDVNRVDPTVQTALMRGVWQHMIPVQGQGTNIIGEVSRSSMPQENFIFDRIAKTDYAEAMGVGQADTGQGIETKGEANVVQGNMQTRIGRERAKVGKFFCSIAEVLGGLICIYEDPASFGEGFSPLVSKTLNYSILADSTLLLDSNQRLKRLIDFVNFGAKSGWVDIESVMKEIATLTGLDPNVTIRAPQPKPPVEPNISLRLTGTEDLMNPLVLAFLINAGQAPGPDKIEQAKKMIEAAVLPPPPQPPPVGPDGQPMGPMPPGAPPGSMGPLPEPPPPAVGQANPEWSAMPRVNQRVIEQ